MRIGALVLAAALSGCASSKETSRDAAVASQGRPATTQGAAGEDAGAARDDGPCARDEDCAFTRVEPSGCCPMLCTPRAVTRVRAQQLEDGIDRCRRERSCPAPLCRPEQPALRPVCFESRCVARPSARPMEN